MSNSLRDFIFDPEDYKKTEVKNAKPNITQRIKKQERFW